MALLDRLNMGPPTSLQSYSLSPAQRLFESSRFEAENGVNIEQVVCTTVETVDLPAFKQAWQTVFEQHSALRVGFRHGDNEPYQEVVPSMELPYSVEEHPNLSLADRLELVEKWLEKDRRESFCLTEAPLMRVSVLRFADNALTWVWTFHHILMDGRSFMLVLKDFFACYEAIRAGTTVDFPERKHFGDFITWQQTWTARNQEAAQNFWRGMYNETDSQANSSLSLSKASTVTDHRQEKIQLKVKPETRAGLHRLASNSVLTLNSIIQGTWALLLSRYYRSKSVTFSTIRSGRSGSISGADTMVGLLMNSLPVHARISDSISVIDFLKGIKDQQAAARPYQWSSGDIIRRSIPISASRQLADSCVLYERYNIEQELADRFSKNGQRTFMLRERANLPLLLAVAERPQIQFDLIYQAARFGAEDMDQLGTSFLSLLERIVESPNATLASLEVATVAPSLSPAQSERRQRYNATAAAPVIGLLHAGFFAMAAKQPTQIAIDDPECRVSYGELAGYAYSLARRLQKVGVQPGSLVAIVMEKGWEQIASALGILRAGAAYLPIDPEQPKARLDYLLANARVSVVLTQPKLLKSLVWPEGVKLWTLGEERDISEPYDGPEASPDSLAYVIYTSGSTGQPKGVMIAHQAALNTTIDINRRLEITPADRVLAVSALTFDLSVYDVFGILEGGGTIVLPSQERSRDPSHWIERMNECGVTIWNSAPALMQMLVTVLETSPLRLGQNLRWAMLSGDWIPIDLPDRLRKLVPNCRLLSLGGATEVSIWSIAYLVEKVDPSWTSIPYGMPLTNQTIHVLDDNFEPSPELANGEIFIGGVGLAMGYWADEAKTAERFVRSPVTGEMLYRTGDYGRFRPEGFVEFLGRKDTQVKIRGHRIEIGEIEAAMLRLAGIREAAALAVSEKRAPGVLVGAIVLSKSERSAAAFNEDEMRGQLAKLLPSYMVPSRIVLMEALPLSSNGKVDRTALLAAVRPLLGSFDASIEDAPQDHLEKSIWNIWREILPGRRITVHDRFFEIGGDSLTMLQMMAQVEKLVGRTIGLYSLREGGRIVDIAAAARSTGPVAAPSLMTCTQPGTDKPPFFFAHGDLGSGGLYCQRMARELGPDQPFYSITPPGTFGGDLPDAFEEVAAEHVKLIQSVQPKGPYYLGGYCNGAVAMYEAAQQLIRAGESVGELVLLDPPDLYYFSVRKKLISLGQTIGLKSRLSRDFLDRTAQIFVSAQYHFTVSFLWQKLRHKIFLATHKVKCLLGKAEPLPRPTAMLVLNDHYIEVIAGYKLERYLGTDSVSIILRKEDLKLTLEQTKRWSVFIPRARFEGISGNHVELKNSLSEIAEIIRNSLSRATAKSK